MKAFSKKSQEAAGRSKIKALLAHVHMSELEKDNLHEENDFTDLEDEFFDLRVEKSRFKRPSKFVLRGF